MKTISNNSPVARKKQLKNFTLVLVLTAMVVAALGVLGKSLFEASPKIYSRASEAKPTPSGESSPEVMASDSKSELPSGFPKDFPIYPRAELKNSWTSQENNLQGLSVFWQSPDPLKEIKDHYQKALKDSGWEIVSLFDEEDSIAITFAKDDIQGFIGLVEEGSLVLISVTLNTP